MQQKTKLVVNRPVKMRLLLTEVLESIAKVRRRRNVEFDMRGWVSKDANSGVCHVCVAGAWLISMYDPRLESQECLSVFALPKDVALLCNVMDTLRFGGYTHAFDMLGIRLTARQRDRIDRAAGSMDGTLSDKWSTNVDEIKEHLTKLQLYCIKEDL